MLGQGLEDDEAEYFERLSAQAKKEEDEESYEEQDEEDDEEEDTPASRLEEVLKTGDVHTRGRYRSSAAKAADRQRWAAEQPGGPGRAATPMDNPMQGWFARPGALAAEPPANHVSNPASNRLQGWVAQAGSLAAGERGTAAEDSVPGAPQWWAADEDEAWPDSNPHPSPSPGPMQGLEGQLIPLTGPGAWDPNAWNPDIGTSQPGRAQADDPAWGGGNLPGTQDGFGPDSYQGFPAGAGGSGRGDPASGMPRGTERGTPGPSRLPPSNWDDLEGDDDAAWAAGGWLEPNQAGWLDACRGSGGGGRRRVMASRYDGSEHLKEHWAEMRREDRQAQPVSQAWEAAFGTGIRGDDDDAGPQEWTAEGGWVRIGEEELPAGAKSRKPYRKATSEAKPRAVVTPPELVDPRLSVAGRKAALRRRGAVRPVPSRSSTAAPAHAPSAPPAAAFAGAPGWEARRGGAGGAAEPPFAGGDQQPVAGGARGQVPSDGNGIARDAGSALRGSAGAGAAGPGLGLGADQGLGGRRVVEVPATARGGLASANSNGRRAVRKTAASMETGVDIITGHSFSHARP